MAEPDELLTVAETAAELKMTQQTIRNWIDSGYLPAIRIGRRAPVKRSDFDALLEASHTGTKRPPAGVWDGDVPTPVGARRGRGSRGTGARPGGGEAGRLTGMPTTLEIVPSAPASAIVGSLPPWGSRTRARSAGTTGHQRPGARP